MEKVTLKKALCQEYGIQDKKYIPFVVSRCLFFRMRAIAPLASLINPNFLFHEHRLVEQVARTSNMKEVQEEIDFYQHKYVVNSVWKDAFRFRLSGMRLMRLANRAFQASAERTHPG